MALFISCDDKKAKDEIKKAIDKVAKEDEKGTSKKGNTQGSTQTKTKTIQVVQGKVQITEGEEAGGDTPPPTLTKPVLSAQRIRKETPITFTKVTGHTYTLKNATSDVTISDVMGDVTKKQVSSTVVLSGIIVVATLDGNSIESDPIDFLLHVADRTALKEEIKRTINRYGNNVDLNYIDTSSVVNLTTIFLDSRFNGKVDKWDTSNVELMVSTFEGTTAFNQSLNTWDVSSVRDTRNMFYGATAFNQPLDKWDVSSVEDMSAMFQEASAFNQNISEWVNKSGRDSTNMFRKATAMITANMPPWVRPR